MNAQAKMIALHHLDCPLRPSDVEHFKRNIEKHNQTSRNILNKYAQNQITNADFTLFINTAAYPPTPGRYTAVLFHRSFFLDYPPTILYNSINPKIQPEVQNNGRKDHNIHI